MGEGESEKSIRSFPLIMCVSSITVSNGAALLVTTTAQRVLNYCIVHTVFIEILMGFLYLCDLICFEDIQNILVECFSRW